MDNPPIRRLMNFTKEAAGNAFMLGAATRTMVKIMYPVASVVIMAGTFR